MRFQLDENFGPSVAEIFVRRGHDCGTVRAEGLGGATDERVLSAAFAEGRILVAMDHDFGNVLRYPPGRTPGIAVLNPSGRTSLSLLRSLVEALLVALERKAIRGRLWVVEPSRIREHEPEEPLESSGESAG